MSKESEPQYDSTLQFIWGQFKTFDVTSTKLKKELVRWRVIVFVTMVLGAFTAILSENAGKWAGEEVARGLGLLSAIAIGITGYAGSKILNGEKEKKWLQARAATESCKSAAYLYLLKVSPYNAKDGYSILFNKVENIIKSLYDIPLAALPGEEEIKDMPPLNYSFQNYLEERVRGQARGYYAPKANRYNKMVKRGGNWGLALGIIGVILGSVAASGQNDYTAVWIAFISTLSASIASYISSNRYQYLAMSFQATANQLMLLWARGSRIDDEDKESQKNFIKTCEEIFSKENEAWISELSKEEQKEK